LPPLLPSLIASTVGVSVLPVPTTGVSKVCVAGVVKLSPLNNGMLNPGVIDEDVVPLNTRVSVRAVTVRTAGVISPVLIGT
jgi:hypothetical protein